jgi:hypothetical protein
MPHRQWRVTSYLSAEKNTSIASVSSLLTIAFWGVLESEKENK